MMTFNNCGAFACVSLLLLSAGVPLYAMEKSAQEKSPVHAQDGEIIPLSCIIHAARYGSLQDLQMALELNPDAGVYDKFGFSALHLCLFNSCEECALAMVPLLASKIGVDYPTQKGKAAQLDNSSNNSPYNRTALFIAAQMGHKSLMRALLALKADINQPRFSRLHSS